MRTACDVVLVISIVSGVTALLVEHGAYLVPPWTSRPLLWAVQVVVALSLLAERIIRIAASRHGWSHLRNHWHDVMVPVVAVIVGWAIPTSLPPWMVMAKLQIAGSVAVRGVSLYARVASAGVHPSRLLVGSFGFAIVVGTGLLMLPRAVPEGDRIDVLDAFFTATSATCVTGLIVRDTGTEFTRFGQTVVLCLIQLGGLGIMTFGTLFLLLGGRGLGLRQQATMGEVFSDESPGKIGRTVRFIVLLTLVAELVGALAIRGLWDAGLDGWYQAVFHSVSAFCNAGFSLQATSFTAMRDTWEVLVAVPVLIIAGGLGFPVLADLLGGLPGAVRYVARRRRRLIGVPRPRLSCQSKLVLLSTALLLVTGTLGLVLLEVDWAGFNRIDDAHSIESEPRTDWRAIGPWGRWAQSWFHAISARTAGFNTFDLDEMTPAGKLLVIALMVIGGSPASAAGGVKTVTVAVLLLGVWASLRGRPNVEAFGRTLTDQLVRRAVAMAMLFVGLIGITTLLLAVFQGPGSDFIDVLFESVSACGTVGLSLGETARLHHAGKVVIIAAMFIGRVGPLTLLMALTVAGMPPRHQYPSENLVVG